MNWIKLSKKWPEFDERVLFYSPNVGYVEIGHLSPFFEKHDTQITTDGKINIRLDRSSYRYWMPLPSKPENEQ